jgi:uncharacterized protein (TIGR03437 family)
MRFSRLVSGLSLLAAVAWGQSDYDVRDLAASEQAKTTVERRRGAIESFLASPAAGLGMRVAPNRYGLPKTIFREGRALSAPSTLDAEEIARTFLRAHRAIFPLTAPEIDGMRLVGKDASSGAVFLSFNQTLNGLDVYNGLIKFTLNAAGEIVHAGADEVVPELNLPTQPRLSAEDALKAARLPAGTKTELTIFPMSAASAVLAYRLFLEVDSSHWYEILIDAGDGSLLYRHNLYVHAAQGRVWLQSPRDTDRQLVTFPSSWLPATATVTTGNNVDAYLDTNGGDRPDNTTTASLSLGRAFAADQVFDFPFGDGLSFQNPRNFQAAAVTNLFYFINTAHDYYYSLGFDEAAGNFQTDNFGKGGVGGDAVLAEAQHPAARNNASFAPTVEGVAPKIRMGIFTRDTTTLNDDLDSSFDGQVVIHEYGHGVSNRLVGSKISVSCLNGTQSGAMGEGWSDFFSISFFNNPVEGAYLSQDFAAGFRRYSYEGYPLTYEGIGNEGYEVHNDGEIWAATLWDLRKSLGKSVTDLLVMNGLKSTPCHPGMTDARDAILAADLATNGGANRAKIWQIFAKHGLGFSASGIDGNHYPGIYYNAAYDQPADLQPGGNPAITSKPPATQPQIGEQYRYTVTASNPAAGKLAYAVTEGPAGMTIDGNGLLQWTTRFTQQRVKITVTDGKGGKVVHGFVLTPDTTLTLGAPVTIEGALDSEGYANFSVPAGAQLLQVTMRGGTGDADLDLFDPDGFDYYSAREGNDETLSISTPKSGRWRIIGSGYDAFAAVAMTASLVTPTTLLANTPATGLNGVLGSESVYRVTVPPGATSLNFATSGGSGDVDLYVKYGKPAACQGSFYVFEPCIADYWSENEGNAESISVTNPQAGDWYVDVSAYEGYADVTLTATMSAPATLSVAATSVAFVAAEGGAAPAAQTLGFSDASGSAFAWTAAVSTASGGNWLAISKTSGTGNASLQVTVDPKGLKAGVYQGAITLTAATLAGSPVTIPVTLTVTGQPVLHVSTTSLSIAATSGQDPAIQVVAISNAGGGTLNWTATAATGGNWLEVRPTSGTGNSTISIVVTTGELAPGTYAGTITIAAAGASGSPAVVQVGVTVTAVAPAGPVIASGGVVGGGGSIPSVATISPGGLATIFGAGFAPVGTARAVQANDLVSGNLPTNLAGTCVDLDGKAGYLTFVSPGQINFQVPAVALDTLVNVRVVANCGAANEVRGSAAAVRSAAASPEFLYWVKNADGKDPLVAVNAVTGAYVGANGLIPGLGFAPAKPGDILTIYGVSFGPTAPAFAPGTAPASTAATVNAASVKMGSVTLNAEDVLYAGVSPGIAGLYQLNIRVPANLADGDQAVTLTLGNFQTPALGFITVKAGQ